MAIHHPPRSMPRPPSPRSRRAGTERATCETRGQRLAFEIFHHQEIDGLDDARRVIRAAGRERALAADVVQDADVRVIERRDCPRLALEALTQLRVGGQRTREDLDGDAAIEPRVTGSIDFAHAAGSERFDDFVRTEPRAGRECHGWRRPRIAEAAPRAGMAAGARLKTRS